MRARARCSRGLDLDIDVRALLGSYSGGGAADGGDRARARRLGARADPRRADLEPRRATRCRALFAVLSAAARRAWRSCSSRTSSTRCMRSRDRITVLRNGQLVGEYPAAELAPPALVAAMVGPRVSTRARRAARHTAATAAESRAAVAQPAGSRRRGAVEPVDLELRARRGGGRWPACSARAAPSSRGCCSASTPRRAAIS